MVAEHRPVTHGESSRRLKGEPVIEDTLVTDGDVDTPSNREASPGLDVAARPECHPRMPQPGHGQAEPSTQEAPDPGHATEVRPVWSTRRGIHHCRIRGHRCTLAVGPLKREPHSRRWLHHVPQHELIERRPRLSYSGSTSDGAGPGQALGHSRQVTKRLSGLARQWMPVHQMSNAPVAPAPKARRSWCRVLWVDGTGQPRLWWRLHG